MSGAGAFRFFWLAHSASSPTTSGTKLEDSPAFVKMEEGNKEAEHPTHLVFKKYRKRLLSSVAATMVNAVGFYLVLTYLPTYLTSYTSMEASQAQLATDIALIAICSFIFGSGTLIR